LYRAGLESWYLRQAKDGDFEAVLESIENLSSIGSIKAIPLIIRTQKQLLDSSGYGGIGSSGFWMGHQARLNASLDLLGRPGLVMYFGLGSMEPEPYMHFFARDFVRRYSQYCERLNGEADSKSTIELLKELRSATGEDWAVREAADRCLVSLASESE
jgi:hypothetical protein